MLNKKTDETQEKNLFEEDNKSKKLSALLPVLIFICGFAFSLFSAGLFHIAQNQATEDGLRKAESEIRSHIVGEMENFERTVRMVGSLIEVSNTAVTSDLQNRIVYNVPDVSLFDRIVLVSETTSSNWKVRDIVTTPRENREFYPNWNKNSYKHLISYILEGDIVNNPSVMVFTDIPATKYWQQYSEPIVRTRPIAVAVHIEGEDGRSAIVVGLTRVTNILDGQWMAEHKNISDLILSDMARSDVILQIDKPGNSKKSMEEILAMQGHIFTIGGKRLQLHVVPTTTVGTLVKYVPLCIAVLGILLSLLAAIFFNSSRKTSAKIKKLSNSYVQKNYELNIELAERERLHNLLFSAEREFRILVDSVSDIVLEISPQGEIVFINKAWEKITGFSVEGALEQSFFSYIHSEDVDDLRANFKLVFRGQKFSHHSKLRLKTDDGRFRQVQLSISSIRNEDKAQPRLIMTIMDIEAQQRTKKALSDAEEKYRTIIENAAGGFYQVTAEGQILSTNPALVDILGYESEIQLKDSIDNLFSILFLSNNDKARFLKELEVHGAVKNFENKTSTFNRRNEIWLNQNARTVKDDAGNVLYLEGSIENVSQRKEFEQKLKQAKIESDLANRAKSEFLANMSHELRTPLNAIIGFSEIIKDEVLGPVQNKQYWEYASDIYKSGKSLLKIINEILDVSRIETGERQLNESNVDLNKVVESCFDFARSRMEEADQLTITNMSEGKLPNIIGEELAIKQIFINILSNAIKFTPSGGRITLSHEIASDGGIRISVTDTGIGLNEAEIEKALSPFGQIDTAMSRAGSGAGLGLNLVNSLTKLHGGRLELFSQKGVGTTVTVTMPAKRVAQSQSSSDDSANAAKKDEQQQQPVSTEDATEDKTDAFESFFSEDDDSEDGATPTIQ